MPSWTCLISDVGTTALILHLAVNNDRNNAWLDKQFSGSPVVVVVAHRADPDVVAVDLQLVERPVL